MTSVGGASEDAAGGRDRFIPIRKADILDALVKHDGISSTDEREKFRQVCGLLSAIYHHEYFDLLEELRHDYFYFDPEVAPHAAVDAATLDHAYAELVDSLVSVLKDANFVEVSHEEITGAHQESVEVKVALETPLDDFREVRCFRRGHHHQTVTVKQWFGLHKQTVDLLVYDDVVLFVAMKTPAEIASERERERLSRRHIRPGSVLIKHFRDIAKQDLNALYPNVRVVMTLFDKLFLAVPAIAGGIPILLNLWSTVTVLFLVIGFYLGIAAAIEDSQMKSAFAALSGLVALGAFVVRQWGNYQRQALKHQMAITDNVYYRNVNNNAGIFDTIIGSAEDQECKETFLAYYFLRASPQPPTQGELDDRIMRWLRDTFSVNVDFAVDEALKRLDRLGLLRRDGDRLSVPPPADALVRLDFVWDNYFQYYDARTQTVQPTPAK